MNVIANKITTVTDDEIKERLAKNKTKGWTTYDNVHVISRYESIEDDGKEGKNWGGFCVPSSFCWVYKGLYRYYNGTDIHDLKKGFYLGDWDYEDSKNYDYVKKKVVAYKRSIWNSL